MIKVIKWGIGVALVVFIISILAFPALPAVEAQTTTGVQLNSFYVSFEGRVYNRTANTTTYTYIVTGNGQRPDLSHFDLGIPTCQPPLRVASYSPTEAVEFGVDPNTRVSGVKWGQPLKTNSSRTYSITFVGNWKALLVDVAVKDGDGEHLGKIPGPSCEPAESLIDVEKYLRLEGMTDTWLDVDEAPGIPVTINWPVYFKYTVTNTGDQNLTNLTLTDDKINVSSCILPASIPVGGTFECEVGPFNAVTGQHTNTATATGVMAGETWNDSDKANYTGINGPVLLAPHGKLVQTIGNPTFKWTVIAGVTSYNFYLARASSPAVPVFSGMLPAAQHCGLLTCSVNLTSLPDGFLYWLFNGDYIVLLNASGSSNWYGPFEFSIDAPRATAVTPAPVENTGYSRPTIKWALQGDAAYSSWFLVYIAPENNLSVPVVFNWYTRQTICGANLTDINCALQLNVDLQNGSYTMFIQNWGPAGPATGGLANSGFAGPVDFTIAAGVPSVITNLAVTGAETGQPAFVWTHDPGVTWYQVWVGSPDYTKTGHAGWYLQSDLNCSTTCTLTGINLPAGNYVWFLQGWGAGGLTQGGNFAGWAVGQPFTVTQ